MTISVELTVPAGKQARLQRRHDDGRTETTLLQPGRHHTALWHGVELSVAEINEKAPETTKEVHFQNEETAE